jgi:DNA-binding NarL/FixJ family response regulator
MVEQKPAIPHRLPQVVIVGEEVEYELLVRLKAGQPGVGVIVLAHNPTRLYGTLLLEAGITCLARSQSVADILAAADLAAKGERIFVPAHGHRVEYRHGSELQSLTRREAEVLEHLSRGRSAGEIALDLKISVETVRTHISSIRRKLDVQSKRELIGLPLPINRK